jgi:3-dehydroquinate dehydratase/shikimate dehydrogenase
MICLSLTGESRDLWSGSIAAYRDSIDLVELRVDLLKPAERGVDDLAAWWQEQRKRHSIPGVLTIRRSTDMGRWEGDEAQRLHLFSRLVTALRPDYIDSELDRAGNHDWDRLAAQVRSEGGRVIRSHHEVRSTPDGLPALMARLAAESQEIPKLAVMPQSATDTVRLVNAARSFGKLMPGRQGIWVAMGEYGLPTRVWPARTGSLLTYSSDPAGPSAAPGHIGPRELREVYRVDLARPEWPAFAVLGSPVVHSRSPEYHNARFRDDGIEAIYLPIRIDSFQEFPGAAAAFGLIGASVTVPHKDAARGFAVAAGAEPRPGVANTLWRTENGWEWDNTDVPAFLDAITGAYGGDLERVRLLVIGAGGTARSVIAALAGRVGTVTIANRTESRAKEVAEEFGLGPDATCALSALADHAAGSFDVIVQTTSVGMSHGTPGDPSAGYSFSGAEFLFDVIYTPEETEFLARGRAAGCTVANGAGMFEGQARRQYDRFRTLATGAPG